MGVVGIFIQTLTPDLVVAGRRQFQEKGISKAKPVRWGWRGEVGGKGCPNKREEHAKRLVSRGREERVLGN